eukprot:TRINITY_DN11571_c0_g1_i1.p1 TRINITY_DN11571_c0_g1~~TRINITY_DN11571_c0_g1_i1.p1  ORF type:complete len:152 (-),score=17.53 TRINITY_DN11571_c0_g1_i1:89-544(-)
MLISADTVSDDQPDARMFLGSDSGSERDPRGSEMFIDAQEDELSRTLYDYNCSAESISSIDIPRRSNAIRFRRSVDTPTLGSDQFYYRDRYGLPCDSLELYRDYGLTQVSWDSTVISAHDPRHDEFQYIQTKVTRKQWNLKRWMHRTGFLF